MVHCGGHAHVIADIVEAQGNQVIAFLDDNIEQPDCSGPISDYKKYPDVEYGTIFRINGIYEENGQKFVLLNKINDNNLYIVDFSFDEEGNLVMAEEARVAVSAIIETGEVTKFDEPENVDKLKIFEKVEPIVEPENVQMDDDNKEPEIEPIVEPEQTNYEELYNELQTKFNELVSKYSSLEDEIVPLRQFKAEVEAKENEEKLQMELKEKNDLIEIYIKIH